MNRREKADGLWGQGFRLGRLESKLCVHEGTCFCRNRRNRKPKCRFFYFSRIHQIFKVSDRNFFFLFDKKTEKTEKSEDFAKDSRFF